MKSFLSGVVICLALVAGMSPLTGCSKSSSGGGASVKMTVKNVSAGTLTRQASLFDVAASLFSWPGRDAGDYGAAAASSTELSSFKLFIQQIQFCNSIETSGSAYNNPKGCTNVYTNPLATDDYNTFDPAAATAASAGKYVDLLSSTDRDSLTQNVAMAPGTYNVGLINWYRPLKVTATVPLQNANKIYTKTCPGSGSCTVTSDMGTGPAQESVFDSGNGGTWMRFLKPFVVAAGDSTAVDLAFDLDKRVFAGNDVSNGFIQQTSGCTAVANADGYCGVYFAGLRLQPVARKSTETTMVETYDMDGPNPAEWRMRVDVYYNSADATKSTLAADIFPLPGTNNTTSVAAGVYVYNVSETGGVTTFQGYDSSTQLVFTRGTSGTGTLTCVFRCGPGWVYTRHYGPSNLVVAHRSFTLTISARGGGPIDEDGIAVPTI